jgi:8-oxo-dGTP diphosphatase
MRLAPLTLLPSSALSILREMARHVLRHPVVGVLAVARDESGKYLLIRRADTGTWSMPGGTLEWGETLRTALAREVKEESGATVSSIGRLVGVYTRPDRDPRFHAVTIVVEVTVDASRLGPSNPLEIREAKLFERNELPASLAMGAEDMLRDALEGEGLPILE